MIKTQKPKPFNAVEITVFGIGLYYVISRWGYYVSNDPMKFTWYDLQNASILALTYFALLSILRRIRIWLTY